VKVFKKISLLCALLMLSAPAWSIPMSTVGGVDDLLGQTRLSNSGINTEVNWIESVLGIQIDNSLYSQTEVDASDWLRVDGTTGVFATDLVGDADWFLVKIGNNSGTTNTHFLFDNLGSLSYAVIDLVEMGFNSRNTLNIGKVSHLGSVPVASVPEPGTLALMSLGMLGFGIVRRRKAS